MRGFNIGLTISLGDMELALDYINDENDYKPDIDKYIKSRMEQQTKIDIIEPAYSLINNKEIKNIEIINNTEKKEEQVIKHTEIVGTIGEIKEKDYTIELDGDELEFDFEEDEELNGDGENKTTLDNIEKEQTEKENKLNYNIKDEIDYGIEDEVCIFEFEGLEENAENTDKNPKVCEKSKVDKNIIINENKQKVNEVKQKTEEEVITETERDSIKISGHNKSREIATSRDNNTAEIKKIGESKVNDLEDISKKSLHKNNRIRDKEEIKAKEIIKDYSNLDIEALYKEVKTYMEISGVGKIPISKKDLEEKFGKNNIHKLLVRSYLISLGNRVTAGR